MQNIYAHLLGLPKGQKVFLVSFATLIVIPFVALLMLQVYNAWHLALIADDLANRSDNWKNEALSIDAQVDPASLSGAASQHAYRMLASHDEVMPDRRIVVTFQVPLGNLKPRKDVAVDEGALLDAAAEKIQDMGAAECALIVGTLASDCTVMSATGRPAGTQAYEYQLQLAFAEKNGFGKADPAATYELVLSRSSPGKAATGNRIYFEKSAKLRREIYQDVAATCAAIRRKAGNCSVTALTLSSRLDRGTPMVRLAASATYASLMTPENLALSTR